MNTSKVQGGIRVVITGMGVVAPNAHGLESFAKALKLGVSGVDVDPRLARLKFSCQVSATPKNLDQLFADYFDSYQLSQMNECISIAGVAALDAMQDAGILHRSSSADHFDIKTGAVIGTGIGYLETFGFGMVPQIISGDVRRLGSTAAGKVMVSAISAHLGGLLGLGGPVFTTSCACATGTDALILAAEKIRLGVCDRMLAGGAEGSGPMNWAGLESLRVLSNKHNDRPENASRPMSASSSGLVPGSGAGVLVLENLESARDRGAHIYAELLGGATTSGGLRNGGTMTAPSPEGVQRCIKSALSQSGISHRDIDYINGHLTGTVADSLELANWIQSFDIRPDELPFINSTKSLLGHTLGASGTIEVIATLLQMQHNFLHASVNCEDLRPDLKPFESRIVRELVTNVDIQTAISASFGFGDVNSCVALKKWS